MIEDDKQFDGIMKRLSYLIGKGRSRTPDETKLYKLLDLRIEDYNPKYGMPPDSVTRDEALQFLLDHSEKPANELLAPVFGQRRHVHEALTGKRPISAAPARKLGQILRVKSGLFVR
uniref:Uncharacterized protein n=1 Tax=Solibacter usitatus (strain Ellin6076) TaxID=234267 RepID=Q01S53_SOLUE